jgi:hypothetical protein
MAPSILAEGPRKRLLKRLVTFAERWFILIFGGVGMLLLLRSQPKLFWYFGLYLAGSSAVLFVAYSNARIFLPVTGVLIVPAALAIAEIWNRVAGARDP